MRLLRLPAALVVTAALAGPAPAQADDFCVGEAAPCVATLELALQAASERAGADRVLLGEGEHEVPAGRADAAGEPVEIVGAGPGTRLLAAAGAAQTLWLAEAASRVSALAVTAPGAAGRETLLLAGIGNRLLVSSAVEQESPAVRLLPGGRLAESTVSGSVTATAAARIERSVLLPEGEPALMVAGGDGFVVVESTEVALSGAAAVEARCGTVALRHLTITGAAPRVLDLACPEAGRAAALDLRSSIVHGDFPDVARVAAGATATSSHSAHAADDAVAATARRDIADPGFASSTDLRPGPGSPLVDAGDPAALQPGEGFWDLGNRSRVTDGDGDRALRRDIGAHELQPPAGEAPAGNVLLNPGAESGPSTMSTAEGPEPPGWTRTGAFTQVAYGTAARTPAGDVALPTREAGEALGGGMAFFSAGPGESARLVQRIDVSASAREIDTGLASAALSALLGGYGADDDEARVTATFRDPAGVALASLGVGPVTPADRANATNLLHRSAAGAIPERTRAIDVEVAGRRISAPGSAESYADAYADNLALVLSVPGVVVPGPVDPGAPPVRHLRPFAGIVVLTGRPRLSPRGRTRIGLACATATAGRCAGTLELRAQLRRGLAFSRIAQIARFGVAPGASAEVTVKLTMAARRALRRARSFRATLHAVARDGQGLERRTTIPVRVVRSRPRRR